MTMTGINPGDLVTVNVDSSPDGTNDTTFVAWVIDLNVRPRWNEGERMVRVEPAANPGGAKLSTYHFVSPRQIVGHAPWRKGRQPGRILKVMRDWDPYDEMQVPGGVID